MKNGIIYKKIILASASPRRSELLSRARIPFEIKVSNAVEDNSPELDPVELVRRNALNKALAVAEKCPDEIVLGADTIVALGTKTYGKPVNADDARRILGELAGKTHSVFTGIALVKKNTDKSTTAVEESRVTFKNLNADQIDEYISKVDVLDKAGAYAAQECGSMIIEKIDGNFDNVMGLPCGLVEKKLAQFQ